MVVVIGFSFVALECLVLFEIWGLYVQTSRSNKKKNNVKVARMSREYCYAEVII